VHSGAYELTVDAEGIATVHCGWSSTWAKLILNPDDGNGQAGLACELVLVVIVVNVNDAAEVGVGSLP
jgi:hypothetical protein